MILRHLKLLSFFLLLLLGGSTLCKAATDSTVTVLYVGEPAPKDATKIGKQGFTGNDITKDCSYYELLLKTRSVAKGLGANLIKIDSRRERSQKFDCDELNVTFYSVPDIRPFEKHISWTAGRKLVWDDFKGPVPANAPPRFAAVTSAGIAIETNTASTNNPPKVYIYNTFETATSWVKQVHRTDAILQHEQTHFDICELYTRKMRERFNREKITVNNLQQVIRSSYEAVFKEQMERQNLYESETQHGIIDKEQARWTKMIDEELSKTTVWASK